MAMAIVDFLDVINVEKQEGQGLAEAVCLGDLDRRDLFELPPVPGPGEGVRGGELVQFLVGGP